MKLLIICMSLFLFAFTPASKNRAIADKYNVGAVDRELVIIESLISRASRDGKYYIQYCFKSSISNELDNVLIKSGYMILAVENINQCPGWSYPREIQWGSK